MSLDTNDMLMIQFLLGVGRAKAFLPGGTLSGPIHPFYVVLKMYQL